MSELPNGSGKKTCRERGGWGEVMGSKYKTPTQETGWREHGNSLYYGSNSRVSLNGFKIKC